MGIYVLMLVIVLSECFLFLNLKKEEYNMKLFFYLTIIFIALITGMRAFSVGHDTANYANIFSQTAKLKFKQLFITKPYNEIEYGYLIFSWLFAHVSHNPSHFFIVISFFQYISIGFWIWDNSKKPFLSLLVFICMFYTVFLTGIRQCIAFSILLLSYSDIKKERFFSFLIKVILAASFHTTAIFFVIVYFLKKINIGKKYAVYALVCLPFLYVWRIPIFLKLLPFFERYNDYKVLTHGDAVNYTLLLVAIVICAIVMLDFDKGLSNNLEEKKEFLFITNIVATSIVVMPFVGVNGAILRVAMYFNLFICILIVKIYKLFTIASIRMFVKILTISILIALFVKDVMISTTYMYEFVGWENLKWIR